MPIKEKYVFHNGIIGKIQDKLFNILSITLIAPKRYFWQKSVTLAKCNTSVSLSESRRIRHGFVMVFSRDKPVTAFRNTSVTPFRRDKSGTIYSPFDS